MGLNWEMVAMIGNGPVPEFDQWEKPRAWTFVVKVLI